MSFAGLEPQKSVFDFRDREKLPKAAPTVISPGATGEGRRMFRSLCLRRPRRCVFIAPISNLDIQITRKTLVSQEKIIFLFRSVKIKLSRVGTLSLLF